MFSISARFRPSRSKTQSERPGVVFYRISGRPTLIDGPKVERDVNSDIRGIDDNVLQSEKDRIMSHIRLLYMIVERREQSGGTFTTDDVVEDFKTALSGSSSMADIMARARSEFPFRNDLVSVGREFKGDFKPIYARLDITDKDSVVEYISTLSRTLKNEKRNSQARNFLSLLSNLRLFAKDDDLSFSHIDAAFIHRYAVWLKQTGISDSTQSFYLRTLRTVLNKAKKEGMTDVSPDWFSDVDTKIYQSDPTPVGTFSRELLLKIRDVDLSSNEAMALVRDMFMFGYYCGGMELVDVVNLTYDNLRGNTLRYCRRLKGKEIAVVLGAQARAILERYKTSGCHHLFPLLEQSGGIQFSSLRNNVGQHMKALGKFVGYTQLSFSMNIKAYKSIASQECISELLLGDG